MGTEESSIENKKSSFNLATEADSENYNIYDIAENIIFPKTVQPLSQQQAKFIYDSFQKIALFADLPERKKEKVVKKFIACCGSGDEWLLKEGTYASYFFIIAEGQVDVIKSGYLIRTLGVGDCFGEMAILYGISRSSSIRVPKQWRSKNKYYVLSKDQFMEALRYDNPTKNSQFLRLLQNNPFFHYLAYKDKIQLAKYANKITFKPNERILSKFDEPYALFLISSGSVQLSFPNKRQYQISSQQMFGYFGSGKVQCSASSISQIVTYVVGKDSVNRILKGKIKYLFLWNKVKFALINSRYSEKLDLKRIQQITNLFSFKYTKCNQTICLLNDTIRKVYVPISCKEKQQMELVGLQEKMNGKMKYQFDLVADKSGYVAQINAKLLIQMIKNQQFAVQKQEYPTFDLTTSEILTTFPKIQNKPDSMLCRQNKYNLHYSLKVANIDKQQQVAQIKNEYEIYQKINSKFIQSHYFFVQRGKQFLLGKQFIRGTKIREVVLKIGVLPISVTRFYLACIIICLQHLHENGVACTKLKIDSFKIDESGYLCLADLQGVPANIVQVKLMNKTRGKIQSYQYIQNFHQMAEIAYQLFVGKTLTLNDIVGKSSQQIKQLFPNYLVSKQAKQLITKLCNINDPQNAEWTHIKQLSFFKNINFIQLQNKQMEAPIVPGFMFFDNNKI